MLKREFVFCYGVQDCFAYYRYDDALSNVDIYINLPPYAWSWFTFKLDTFASTPKVRK